MYNFLLMYGQGRGQKNFQGEAGNGKEDRKIAKRPTKIALLSLFRGGEAMEKRPKNSKKVKNTMYEHQGARPPCRGLMVRVFASQSVPCLTFSI